MMKKTIMMAMALAASVVVAQSLSLADARAKIGEAISNPAALTATIKQLSAADQKAYLADVNEAIVRMPGSNDARAAAFLAANTAALKGAQKGNLKTLLAEVFATVPPEALTILNERFADDLFNRAANPAVTYTDEEYVKIATSMMEAIHARNASSDNAAVRDTFAVLMLVRASNGSPADLAGKLLEKVDAASRDVARSDWVPAALGAEGHEKSYAPILGAADAGAEPNTEVVLRIAGDQMMEAMLADLNEGSSGAGFLSGRAANAEMGVMSHVDDSLDVGLNTVPFYYNKGLFYSGRPAGATTSGDREIGSGAVVVGPQGLDITYPTATTVKLPGGTTVRNPDGSTSTVPAGGATVTVTPGTVVHLPSGTVIAPGGTPVGPSSRPVPTLPNGKPIVTPDGGEPGPYQDQHLG